MRSVHDTLAPGLAQMGRERPLMTHVRTYGCLVLVSLCACASGVSNMNADSEQAGEAGALRAAVTGGDAGPAAEASAPPASDESQLTVPQLGKVGRNPVPVDPHRVECSKLSEQASDVVTAAVRATPECLTDADCRVYDTGDLSICWGECGTSRWGAAREQAVRAAIASEQVRAACGQFEDLGCNILPPSCPAPFAVDTPVQSSCVAQRCQESGD